ncbi:MAG: BadF/BadG/BcrA/BcrD type ATPase [Chloroflexi bacterium]|nr:MAG: BadF/BadG/BcrA/BcrD type ATPase [Chloroflexota bacterium]
MAYLIGVDGGGSKTTALIASIDGNVLGRGIGGSSNYHAVGIEAACKALDQALENAFSSANLSPDATMVKAACFGLAGVDRPGDQAPLQAWAENRWPGMPAIFVSDARLVLEAGTPLGWGIGVICGTGSIVFGRNMDGQTARAGGWGYLLGDEGSGYDIGLTALRSVVRAADGRGPKTSLTQTILSHWGLGAVNDLVSYVYRSAVTKTEIAALAALVEDAAMRGDGVSQGILNSAGHELALAAQVVIHRLKLPQPVPCALVGGIFLNGKLVLDQFFASIGKLGLVLSPVQQVAEPALGAVRLAKERAGVRQ